MRVGRVALVTALVLPVAAACASFTANDATPTASDGGHADATAMNDVTAPDVGTGSDGAVDANALTSCGSIDDQFERSDPVNGQTLWSMKQSHNGSLGIAPSSHDDGTILQTNTDNGTNQSPAFAYLVTQLPAVPKQLTCSFLFRPETTFQTDGSGIDIFQIVVMHADASSVHLRFSFKNNRLELRDDHVQSDGTCPSSSCPLDDQKESKDAAFGQHDWVTMTVTTDFGTITGSDDRGDSVSETLQNLGTPSAVQLLLGVVNFYNDTQLGSYDQFHCDLRC